MDLPLATLMDGPSAAHEAALVRCSTVQWLKYAFVPLPLWSVALIFVALLSVNVFDLVLWFRMLQLQVDSYVTQPYTAQMQFCRKKSQLTSSCPCTKASQCKAAKPSIMSPVTTSLRRSATPAQGEPGQQSSKCCTWHYPSLVCWKEKLHLQHKARIFHLFSGTVLQCLAHSRCPGNKMIAHAFCLAAVTACSLCQEWTLYARCGRL